MSPKADRPARKSASGASGAIVGPRSRHEWLTLLRRCQNGDATCLFVLKEIAAFAYESNTRHDHCAAIGLVEAARSHKEDAFAYEWCATMLRRRAASMTERQPEENKNDEP